MRHGFSLIAVMAALTAVPGSAVHADVLLIERVEASQGVTLPKRGQLMAQVEAQFGAPTRKHASVGGGSARQPPITRWDYPQFAVYFEHDHVVNAVLNRARALEMGPKAAAPDQ